ncbi:hypothetical protein [Kribbella sp. NPDC051718]|uniref:hypothetical protein n=1 Tax=Kribbella sp. NPDC051718 TaxID=3155168 RepID=UPI00344289CB
MLKTQVRGQISRAKVKYDRVAPEPAAVRVCEDHGGALFALATVMMRDQAPAEAAVVEVISAAFPATAEAIPLPAAEVRRELARRVHRRCSRADETTVLYQQRVALALTQCGQLTYRQVADVLRLPAADAAQLLCSGLRQHTATSE